LSLEPAQSQAHDTASPSRARESSAGTHKKVQWHQHNSSQERSQAEQHE
jgi:hypothetical protein